MTKLRLNNNEFTISGYNRYTDVTDGVVHSTANVSLVGSNQYNALTQVGEITDLAIIQDDVTVYELTNVRARITSINENLTGEGVSMNMTISFDSP